MSKENLEQFMYKVADSEELQAKIGEEIDAEALIALGAECGCEFNAEDWIHYICVWNGMVNEAAKADLRRHPRKFPLKSVIQVHLLKQYNEAQDWTLAGRNLNPKKWCDTHNVFDHCS
jgi:hypothetical protein